MVTKFFSWTKLIQSDIILLYYLLYYQSILIIENIYYYSVQAFNKPLSISPLLIPVSTLFSKSVSQSGNKSFTNSSIFFAAFGIKIGLLSI